MLFETNNSDRLVDTLIRYDYEQITLVTPQVLNKFVHDCFFFAANLGTGAKLYCAAVTTQDVIDTDECIVSVISKGEEIVHNIKFKTVDEVLCNHMVLLV